MSSLQKALVHEKKSSLQSALAKEMIQNGGGGKRRARKNPPTVTTAYSSSGDDDDSSSSSSSSSSSDDDSDHEQSSADMMKIRQQAIKLVNTPTVGPHADAARKRHGPQTFVSPYQQQSAGERPASSSSAAPNVSSYQSSSSSSGYQYAMHDPSAHAQARTAEPLSVTSMVVNCVSEVCKSSTSELVSKVLSSGYKSVANYDSPPVNGNWGEIDTSQHGYGNGNRAPAFAQQPSSKNNSNGSSVGKTGFANMPKYQD